MSLEMKNKSKKSKVFKPFKQFRYLRGQVNDPVNRMDLKTFNRHRYNVFCATPQVDSRPFKLNPYRIYNSMKLREDLIRSEQIDRENKELLKKINRINRQGGIVECYNKVGVQVRNLWAFHEKEMKKIEERNREIYKLIVSATTRYSTKEFNEFWKTTLKKIKHSCKLPLVILDRNNVDTLLQAQPPISESLERIKPMRALCYLAFQVANGEYLGRILLELYFEQVPVTVQNFLEICKGSAGLSYKNCPVHRIIRGKYLESGDITLGTGKGGNSVYGKSFREESHVLTHSKAGVISMKRISPIENNSQFCITFTRMEELDHKNVVFGNVVKGNDVLFKIQNYGRRIGKPYASIIISDCGVCRDI